MRRPPLEPALLGSQCDDRIDPGRPARGQRTGHERHDGHEEDSRGEGRGIRGADAVELAVRTRVRAKAPTRPARMPTRERRIACPRTSRKMSRRCAPTARRMPISRVRCATEYASTLESPRAASRIARPPKSRSSSVDWRRGSTVRSATRVKSASRATGRSASSARTWRRIGSKSAPGSPSVRTMSDSVGDGCWKYGT